MGFRTLTVQLILVACVLGSGAVPMGQASRGSAALMNPADLKERASDQFTVNLDTTQGMIVIECHRDWGPNGADRFYNLVKRGFYDGTRFYRVIPKLVAQFGISGDPAVTKALLTAYIPDDPPKQTNKRGTVSYAGAGLGRRTTIISINLADNTSYDREIVPFGQVTSGMNVADKIYSGYGENPPTGTGPTMNRYRLEGNAYVEKEFPNLDYIKTATIAQ